jgi:hypothetical protein
MASSYQDRSLSRSSFYPPLTPTSCTSLHIPDRPSSQNFSYNPRSYSYSPRSLRQAQSEITYMRDALTESGSHMHMKLFRSQQDHIRPASTCMPLRNARKVLHSTSTAGEFRTYNIGGLLCSLARYCKLDACNLDFSPEIHHPLRTFSKAACLLIHTLTAPSALQLRLSLMEWLS